MSTRLSHFVYAERMGVEWLTAQCPARQVFAGELPVPWTPTEIRNGAIQVIQAPGTDDGVTTVPLLDLHCFGATYDQMWDVTKESVEAMRLLGQQQAIDGQLVDTVVARMLPAYLPWSRDVPRTVATYEIHMRTVSS